MTACATNESNSYSVTKKSDIPIHKIIQSVGEARCWDEMDCLLDKLRMTIDPRIHVLIEVRRSGRISVVASDGGEKGDELQVQYINSLVKLDRIKPVRE